MGKVKMVHKCQIVKCNRMGWQCCAYCSKLADCKISCLNSPDICGQHYAETVEVRKEVRKKGKR